MWFVTWIERLVMAEPVRIMDTSQPYLRLNADGKLLVVCEKCCTERALSSVMLSLEVRDGVLYCRVVDEPKEVRNG